MTLFHVAESSMIFGI